MSDEHAILIYDSADINALEWREMSLPETARVSGVYAWDRISKPGIAYVGQSADIGARLSAHKSKNTFSEKRYRVLVFETDDDEYRKYVEARCIHFLKPLLNKKQGSIPDRYLDAHIRGAWSMLNNSREKSDKQDDKVKAFGVGLPESEWAAFEAIAERMGVSRYDLAVWALRDFMRRYGAGELPVKTVTRETLPGLGA